MKIEEMTKPAYHHGDLRQTLIAAALAVIERGGAEAMSVRELAESAGVSRAAPYRHFADRDELLACVAARGFEDLNRDYEAALAGPGDGMQRLRAASRVHVDVAERRPGLFKLMFESDLLARQPPPAVMIPPANQSYFLLWRAVEGADPTADEKTVKARTITMWSTLYGFLALDRVRRFKPFMTEPLTRDEVIEAVVEAAIRG
jgi:AcrR family transcriptional regulator